MKKQNITIALMLVLASCVKNIAIQSAFSYHIDNTQIYGNNYTAVYHYDTAANMQAFQAKFYSGNINSGSYVQLNFISNNYILPGTYIYNDTYPNNTTGNLVLSIDSAIYSETSGDFQITQMDSVNHKISGRFQFTAINVANASDIINITGGTFTNLTYQIQ